MGIGGTDGACRCAHGVLAIEGAGVDAFTKTDDMSMRIGRFASRSASR